MTSTSEKNPAARDGKSTAHQRRPRKSHTAFWANVSAGAPGVCWPWDGPRIANHNGRGYGVFCVAGERAYAHRFAYEDRVGPIPAGLFVCHRCDNPPCVNPAHLFLGTAQDNVRDMHAKGRYRGTVRTPDAQRLCRWCGRSTLKVKSSKKPRECAACQRAALRNGRCTECRAPLSTWRGRVRAHTCDEPRKLTKGASP